MYYTHSLYLHNLGECDRLTDLKKKFQISGQAVLIHILPTIFNKKGGIFCFFLQKSHGTLFRQEGLL